MKIGYFQRRKLGITFLNIRRVLKDLKAAGEVDGQDAELTSLAVMERLADENPKGWGENIDWDKLFLLIERFVELLLKFLPFIL